MLTRFNVAVDSSIDEQQLIDPDVINRFTEYSGIEPRETVLEIGPGAGNITEQLLKQARYLICIEKNPKYIPILEHRFKGSDNLKVIAMAGRDKCPADRQARKRRFGRISYRKNG